jgi:hypothetical protein
MPNGALSLSMRTLCASGLPSPLVSRSSRMRLLGPLPLPPCALASTQSMILRLGRSIGSLPFFCDSTTSRSPLGSARTLRGFERPVAIASILKPCGTVGVSPGSKPITFETFTPGSNAREGAGSCGSGPYWVDLSKLSWPLWQAASARHVTIASVVRAFMAAPPSGSLLDGRPR